MTIGLQLVLCLACCAPALTATAQPSECASTDTGSELPDLSELRQVLGEAEQAVERLQQAVQRHKSFISGQVRHTQVSKVKSQPEPDYAGEPSAWTIQFRALSGSLADLDATTAARISQACRLQTHSQIMNQSSACCRLNIGPSSFPAYPTPPSCAWSAEVGRRLPTSGLLCWITSRSSVP